MYLIQGVFWQVDPHRPYRQVPPPKPINFSGRIWQEGKRLGHFTGTMIDQYGVSELGNIKITPTRIDFMKLRAGSEDGAIKYYMCKNGKEQDWVGFHISPDRSQNLAVLTMTEVSDDLFALEQVQRSLDSVSDALVSTML